LSDFNEFDDFLGAIIEVLFADDFGSDPSAQSVRGFNELSDGLGAGSTLAVVSGPAAVQELPRLARTPFLSIKCGKLASPITCSVVENRCNWCAVLTRSSWRLGFSLKIKQIR
jgi:hypothetical protein